MHIVTAVLMGVGAVLVLALGLSSVLRDLLERGPHEPPLLEDDGLTWPRRYQGQAEPANARFQSSSRWAGGHDSAQR